MSAKQLAALKMRSRQPSAGSPIAENHSSLQAEFVEQPAVCTIPVFCICNRQPQDILCRSCGYCFVGRVRKKCPVHPNAILLMDSPCCPKCKTVHLMEIRTSTTPVKKTQEEDDEIEAELKVWRRRRSSSNLGKPREIPDSWEAAHTSWDSGLQSPPGKPQSLFYARSVPGTNDEKMDKEDWNVNLYDTENSSETLSQGNAGKVLKTCVISSPTVQSAGNLGQRFARIATDNSFLERSDSWGSGMLTNPRKRQVLEEWEKENNKMSDICIGDRR